MSEGSLACRKAYFGRSALLFFGGYLFLFIAFGCHGRRFSAESGVRFEQCNKVANAKPDHTNYMRLSPHDEPREAK